MEGDSLVNLHTVSNDIERHKRELDLQIRLGALTELAHVSRGLPEAYHDEFLELFDQLARLQN